MAEQKESPIAGPVLDLDTLIIRPKIAIDGKLYEILSPNELSVVDGQRFSLWGKTVVDLAGDEAKGEELNTLVADLARKVAVGVPDDVFAKLSGMMHFNIVEVFTMLLLATKAKLVGAAAKVLGIDPKALQTGETLSPGSKDSTVGRRTGGSTKRPSQS